MVTQHKEQSWLITASLVILAVVALAVALIYTRAIMIPFVVALFIVALVSPVQDFQVRRLKLPRVIAIIVTLLLVLFILSLVFIFVYQAIQTIVSTAGEYSASFQYMANKVLESVEYIYREEEPQGPAAPNDTGPVAPNNAGPTAPNKPGPTVDEPPPNAFQLMPMVKDGYGPVVLETKPITLPDEPPADVNESDPNAGVGEPEPLGTKPGEVPRRADTQQIIKQIIKDLRNYIFNIATNAFGAIFGLITGVFFVAIFIIFMLVGRNPHAEHSQVYSDIVQKIRRYVGIKVAISGVTGILVWAFLTSVGLELAGVFGILAFLLNFIPSIGSIIVTFLPIPIAVVQFQSSPWLIVLVILVPGAIQNILGNIVEPKLMGEGLNLHPVTILLALAFWGLLWGIVGMFLAAPITAAIRIVLMQFETLQPIGNLLAGDFTGWKKAAE